ncbi:MAG: hypothetical protein AAFX78_05465 [Cyanobacteria bacterium J06638_20]
MTQTSTDFVLLQDLSGSFTDDLPVLQALAEPLVNTLRRRNADTKFAVASFIDKPQLPFGAPDDFVYETNLALTARLDNVISSLDTLTTQNGEDLPEAQLEALLQVALRTDELGFREDSTRYVMLSTDSTFHVEGDGASGIPPILDPNNGDTVIDPDEDYPSIAQLRTALEDSDIIPIFAVTSDVRDDYEDLVDELDRGVVVTLLEDSSNYVDAARLAFGVIEAEVTITGTIEIDILIGTDGYDGLFGALGNDELFGGLFGDLLDGGAGLDFLYGGAGRDTMRGGGDADFICGHGGRDHIEGGTGDDTVRGGRGDDDIQGEEGDDHLRGDDGDDDIDGDRGDDACFGGDGEDHIRGGIGNDRLWGGDDDDVLSGGDDDDRLDGGQGSDRLRGDRGNDIIKGVDGDDTLNGSVGNDKLIGGTDNDLLLAGFGRDILIGVDFSIVNPGIGEADILISGGRRDVFVLGNRFGVFYDDDDASSEGLEDFALIVNFSFQQRDFIRLVGTRDEYVLEEISLTSVQGTGIFWTNGSSRELIGVVQNISADLLDLANTDHFRFLSNV